MIWVIANKVEEDGSFPTYKYYKKAFADVDIDIYCAGQNDDFSFIQKDDIVLMRTRDQNINSRVREMQRKVGFESTLETEYTDLMTHDKEAIKVLLGDYEIKFPKSVNVADVVDGERYFVKPRYGENSQGIDKDSLCVSKDQVIAKCTSLMSKGIMPMIEEYIEGEDFTTSVIYNPGTNCFRSWSTIVRANTEVGFHTSKTKQEYDFEAIPCDDNTIKKLSNISGLIFYRIGAKHHLRIDSRFVEGEQYVLDVNMIPGLAPSGYMSKCMEVNGISYHDFIRMVVGSAT